VGWQKYNTEKGRIGESRVCDYLKRNGYSILERNFRVPGSELDIIALDKACTTLVCIEVKSWSRPYYPEDDIRYAVSPRKIHRLKRGLASFIASNRQLRYDFIRIDVILLYGGELIHIEGEP
jgi:putative endonuclease